MPDMEYAIRQQTYVHDMSPFGFLKGITGLAAYASRALVCPGTAVAGFANQESCHSLTANFDWLRHIGIGADHLIVVPCENLRSGLLQPNGANFLPLISESIRNGRPLNFFLSRNMGTLVKALGLTWDAVTTAQPEIAEFFDDKHYLRCLGAKLGVDKAFPAWEFVSSNFKNVKDSRKRVLGWARDNHLPTEHVFLKAHDTDGGAGLLRWGPETPEKDVSEFCHQYLPRGLIVDAGYPASAFEMSEYSVKILVKENAWDLLYFSRQIIRRDAHAGNEVAIGEHVLPLALAERVLAFLSPICDEAVKRGYGSHLSRTMGFDFMVVHGKQGEHVLILECNARTTAADYAMAVCVQAAQRFKGQAAVVMENISVPAACHDELRDHYFRGRPWDGLSPGFLIGNAACLVHGKATIFCIADNLSEARRMREKLIPINSDSQLRHSTQPPAP
ncbi:MAG: hypothetical protein PHC53_01190 [Patescibacteria group bacterium]|nr:hypothetical protein [Patescibacteria group bacterium]